MYQQLELVVPAESCSFWDETGTQTRAGVFATFDAMCSSFPKSTVELSESYRNMAISIDKIVVYRFVKVD